MKKNNSVSKKNNDIDIEEERNTINKSLIRSGINIILIPFIVYLLGFLCIFGFVETGDFSSFDVLFVLFIISVVISVIVFLKYAIKDFRLNHMQKKKK